jgi:hypothetical protein
VKRDYWVYGALGLTAVVGAWILFVGLPRWYADDQSVGGPDTELGMVSDGEFVEATLFYISDDGMQLVGFERRLKREPSIAAQARRIVEAQLAEPPPPLLSPIPRETRLNGLYLTDRGDAFVDLSEEVSLGHTGGSLEELFTVYAIVNAVTTNLPSVRAVQILVNGSEVDTLVGHVDLQNPLERNMRLVADPDTAEPSGDNTGDPVDSTSASTL